MSKCSIGIEGALRRKFKGGKVISVSETGAAAICPKYNTRQSNSTVAGVTNQTGDKCLSLSQLINKIHIVNANSLFESEIFKVGVKGKPRMTERIYD